MKTVSQRWFAITFFYGILNFTHSSKDPYRWILSRGKPAVQSSTEGSHVASFATDGDYNNHDLPLNYSQTKVSNNPHLQVDLGKSVPVDFVVVNFPILSETPKMYKSIRVTVGETATIDDPSNHLCFGTYDAWKYNLFNCHVWGRYLTVQSAADNVELSVCEVAVHKRPIESVAYRKLAVASSRYGQYHVPGAVVDMNYKSTFISNQENNPWLRVDLGDTYFVQEVSLWSRHDCCDNKYQTNLEIRAGRSLDDNGNANHLCATSDLYRLEIRSYYCDVIGRYVNVLRRVKGGFLEVNQIVVNPETTDNVAAHSRIYGASILKYQQNEVRRLSDTRIDLCHVMLEKIVDKDVWFKMQKPAKVYKVFIVNNPDRLDELTGFEIFIGSTLNDNSLCLPGLQNMAGVHSASFFCEPRVTGELVMIKQRPADKQMSICEIAVFEETKPMIDRKQGRYVWGQETKDLTLTCYVKGYPAPITSWIKDNEVIKSESNTVELASVSRNQSGEYECWANNTHGVDLMIIDVVISSNLRICTENLELKHVIGKSHTDTIKLKGNEWYSVYDPEEKKFLQFYESEPQNTIACQVWLNGKHPKVQDGVVSHKLCVKKEMNNCFKTIEINIRRCAASYIYNFKDLMSSSSYTFCFMNAFNMRDGVQPAMASPVFNHALSQNVFQRETEIHQSYQCLMMCQLDPRCRSFNFSRKLKVCELNTATNIESPGSYGLQADYDYYHMGSGIAMSGKEDL